MGAESMISTFKDSDSLLRPGGDTAIAPRRGRQFNVVARAPIWHAEVRAVRRLVAHG